MKNVKKLYSIAFDEINNNVCIHNYKQFRSLASDLSVGMILCDPIKYLETCKKSEKKKDDTELMMNIVFKLIENDKRDDIIQYFKAKQLSRNNYQTLLIKNDIQKYFTVVKNVLRVFE